MTGNSAVDYLTKRKKNNQLVGIHAKIACGQSYSAGRKEVYRHCNGGHVSARPGRLSRWRRSSIQGSVREIQICRWVVMGSGRIEEKDKAFAWHNLVLLDQSGLYHWDFQFTLTLHLCVRRFAWAKLWKGKTRRMSKLECPFVLRSKPNVLSSYLWSLCRKTNRSATCLSFEPSFLGRRCDSSCAAASWRAE